MKVQSIKYKEFATLFGFIIMLSLMLFNNAVAQESLLRFPDIHEDLVVFVHGEDIWSVEATGGVANRLTIHDGEERFPRFSPDGNLIAFTGYYDGNPDVYVMNKFGGNITRVTYHPGFDEVIGWHPTENKIMFTAFRSNYPGYSELFLISPDGTGLEKLILHEAARGSFSSDGKQIAYNKVSRENRTWKRYKGGTAQDIYLYNLETDEEKNLSNFEGTDRMPMWIGDKIYFTSDRDRMLNVYSVDPASGQIEQITNHEKYDIRRPEYGGNKIIYELGGDLMVLDLSTKESSKLAVEILTDLPETRAFLKTVKDEISGIDCAPGGERALVTARGEVFTVPLKDGATRNLTNSSGARDKDAVWSPDGKHIAYISDEMGEYNVHIIDQQGNQDAINLTDFKNGYLHSLKWSPDSKNLSFTDHTLTLHILDVDSKKLTQVDKAEYENIDVSLDVKPIYDHSWSPDSRYIAYSKMDDDLVNKVYIYALADQSIHQVSTIFNDFHPAFSKDGKYLFFLSNRRFNPTLCDFEWEMVYKKTTGIYSLSLQKDGEPFISFKSDEVKEQDEAKEDDEEMETSEITIDWEGLETRIEALPVEQGNYRYLSVNDNALFYLNKDEGDFNRFEYRLPSSMDLYSFSIENQVEHKILEGIKAYKLSFDGKKIVYRKGKDVGIINSSETDSKGNNLKLSDLKMWYEPNAEWTQIFNEAWRLERDFYYEPGMHGLDWNEMKEKYGSLMEFASCRQDVQFVIGELIGELNTSHTYIFGGDRKRTADRTNVGMLGATYAIDMDNNSYQFKEIYRVADWSRGIYPPLTKPGIVVNEGDYLLMVNGQEVKADKNIYSYFQDLANKQISITVNSKPSMEGAREYVVKPLSSDFRLRYQHWVESNRKAVEEASDGQIGYLHFPDTYLGSAVEFPKYFYSQTRKKGLIVDGRFNGGGLDPIIFFNRLNQPPHSYWTRRYSHDQTSPAYGVNAHMACLTNRQAGSGGDEFPQEFQQFNMGPVIGTRTWGGLVGVSMFIPLIDGGGITAPDYRIYHTDGSWIVENEGVTPDIIVELTPKEVAEGYDAQLMKGVEVLLKEIKENPKEWPEHGAFPDDN